MLRASIPFFIIGLVAFGLGAGNIGLWSMEVGTLLLKVFAVLAVLGIIGSFLTGRTPKIKG